MSNHLQMARDLVGALFMSMSPALFVAVFTGLLGLTLWAGHHAWRSHRLVQAVAHAPLVDTSSPATGLVKLRGTAQPLAARAGQTAASVVWYSRSDGSGGNRSSLTSTDNFLVRDGHGVCAVHANATDIRPSDYAATDGFLDKSRSSRVEKALYAGDTVFAVGELRRDLPPLAGALDAPCQLARFGGVLLVSGETEQATRVFFRLWSLVQAVLALLCFTLLGLGTWAHVAGYPDGPGGPAAMFLQALRTTPWKFEAGPDHPLWLKPAADEAARPVGPD